MNAQRAASPAAWSRASSGMVGLSFAAVPLYRMFCAATGYGGTPQIGGRRRPGRATARHDQGPLRRQYQPEPAVALRARPARRSRCRSARSSLRPTTGRNEADRSRHRRRDLQRHARQGRQLLPQDRLLLLQRADAGAGPGRCSSRSASGSTRRSPPTRRRGTSTSITLSYTFFRSLDDAARNGGLDQCRAACRARAPTPVRSGLSPGRFRDDARSLRTGCHEHRDHRRRHAALDAPAHAHAIDSSGLKQPYHLVDPSPWPLVGALGGGMPLFGIVEWRARHQLDPVLRRPARWCSASCSCGGATCCGRAARRACTRPVVRLGLRYGMTLFIASEVMFFVGFFWAYFHFALYPDHVLGTATPAWPPTGRAHVQPVRSCRC